VEIIASRADLLPSALLPSSQRAARVYLGNLAPGSRATQKAALCTIAAILAVFAGAFSLLWFNRLP